MYFQLQGYTTQKIIIIKRKRKNNTINFYWILSKCDIFTQKEKRKKVNVA